MIAVKFPQANVELAKNQPEYNNLPAFYGQVGSTEKDLGFVVCFELSSEDIQIVNETKNIWLSQLTFGEKFNPVSFWVSNPFEGPKEYKKTTFTLSDLVSFGNYVLHNRNKGNERHYGDRMDIYDADVSNWMVSDYKNIHFLTAREAQMLELLQYVDQEISDSKKNFDLKLIQNIKQLIKSVKP